MKKGVYIIIAVIFLLAAAVLGFITYSYFNNKKDETKTIEQYKEDEETKESLISFKELNEDEKNTNFFKTTNFSLDIISYASKNDDSYINMKVNNRIVYSSNFYANKFRVYLYNDKYFIEFVSNKTDSETKEIVILSSKGKIDHIFKNQIDNWLSPLDIPSLTNIALTNNNIEATYKSSSKCEVGSKIGYIYTYDLNNFKLLNTKEITCE